jgi:hypothetical protein
MVRALILGLALFLGTRASATDPSGLWAFRAGKVTLFQIALRHEGAGWSGTWIRPTGFEIDGDVFTHVTGPVIRRTAISTRANADGSVELVFDDPRPGAIPDAFRVRVTAKAPIGGWDRTRTYRYVTDADLPSNSEMTALFTADQADRRTPNIDWSIVGPADDKRRARTQALIDAGALHSGDDFLHAAFIFQHGTGPDDHLKAHILATVAVARGNRSAVWIAAATLDRYLRGIGQPQVLGTQFMIAKGKATQEPYNRTLIPDSLRQALNVPPLDQQEAQRQRYEDAASAKR